MTYFTFKPSAPLSAYVRFFWWHEEDVSNGKPFVHFSTADRCPKMIFHYGTHFDELTPKGERRPSFQCGIQGQTNGHTQFITSDKKIGMFGVYLLPGAIPCLFNIAAPEITNFALDLHTFLGNEGRDLEEQMMLAADHRERVEIITGFLESKLRRGLPKDAAVEQAVKEFNTMNDKLNIATLVKKYGLSQRQFERKFKDSTGFTAKTYSRILRFEKILTTCSIPGRSFTEAAHALGYFDQAHFNHEFREFTGLSPKNYFSLAYMPAEDSVDFLQV
jgi:AraC-like DNA-binding protein